MCYLPPSVKLIRKFLEDLIDVFPRATAWQPNKNVGVLTIGEWHIYIKRGRLSRKFSLILILQPFSICNKTTPNKVITLAFLTTHKRSFSILEVMFTRTLKIDNKWVGIMDENIIIYGYLGFWILSIYENISVDFDNIDKTKMIQSS